MLIDELTQVFQTFTLVDKRKGLFNIPGGSVKATWIKPLTNLHRRIYGNCPCMTCGNGFMKVLNNLHDKYIEFKDAEEQEHSIKD
ncbi:hypothetical protein EKK58_11410 [Candidatus Dependentiae bacterium]|nr:MAG: hypothetical protein EKK58_11410 [Candidatus Dependentiae bacterium]